MPTKNPQGVAIRIHPDTYALVRAAARDYGLSCTTLTNYVLREFISSGREIVITRKVEPAPAPPKPKRSMTDWLKDDEDDEDDEDFA